MKKKPFFSIIIPTYNRAEDLQFALHCILRQSFSDFEIIISDNASTDNTREIVSIFKDKRIKYFKNSENKGFYLSVKRAMNYCEGNYVILHGDDDFLFDQNSLKVINGKLKKFKPGYARIKYICRTPDKKRFFDFRIINYFTKDKYLPAKSESKKILSYILGSDPYFVSGIIYKNSLPKDIGIINAEPIPWIKIIFYGAENFGGYFFSQPYMVASWSLWSKLNGIHPVYALRNGKLASENFFNSVKSKISQEEYDKFLHTQLMGIYVNLFPIIKLKMGNKNLLDLSKRIKEMDQSMSKNSVFWIRLLTAVVLPAYIIKTIRDLFFYFYTTKSKPDNYTEILKNLKELEKEYNIRYNLGNKQKRI